uniref:Uncharacterized protein n=1 Tax=Anguilla anguilla TaxID=7936 RepID=A0A0E9Y0I2_ANGAN
MDFWHFIQLWVKLCKLQVLASPLLFFFYPDINTNNFVG